MINYNKNKKPKKTDKRAKPILKIVDNVNDKSNTNEKYKSSLGKYFNLFADNLDKEIENILRL